MKTLRLKISGNVQGVFFRKFVEGIANELKVRGFVRNLDDGKVEVVIEGRDENVNEMLEKCKKGHVNSDVKNVEMEELKHQGFENFKTLKL